jgi:hypothetical protein
MRLSTPRRQIIGFLFTSILGTALHFLFNFTGGQLWAAPLSAVNESVWEHMKLIFIPMFLFSLTSPVDWCIKLLTVWLAMLLIPVLYYTYTGILGRSFTIVDIGIFFLAAGIAYRMEAKLFQSQWTCPLPSGIALALLLLTALAFTILTFLPPQIPLFRDPVTGGYGLDL